MVSHSFFCQDLGHKIWGFRPFNFLFNSGRGWLGSGLMSVGGSVLGWACNARPFAELPHAYLEPFLWCYLCPATDAALYLCPASAAALSIAMLVIWFIVIFIPGSVTVWSITESPCAPALMDSGGILRLEVFVPIDGWIQHAYKRWILLAWIASSCQPCWGLFPPVSSLSRPSLGLSLVVSCPFTAVNCLFNECNRAL